MLVSSSAVVCHLGCAVVKFPAWMTAGHAVHCLAMASTASTAWPWPSQRARRLDSARRNTDAADTCAGATFLRGLDITALLSVAPQQPLAISGARRPAMMSGGDNTALEDIASSAKSLVCSAGLRHPHYLS